MASVKISLTCIVHATIWLQLYHNYFLLMCEKMACQSGFDQGGENVDVARLMFEHHLRGVSPGRFLARQSVHN